MRITQPRLVDLACVLALVAMAMMVWSILDPRPLPVILAMSIGQAIGTASLVALLVAIARAIRARIRR